MAPREKIKSVEMISMSFTPMGKLTRFLSEPFKITPLKIKI
jgi:hypothetical protein